MAGAAAATAIAAATAEMAIAADTQVAAMAVERVVMLAPLAAGMRVLHEADTQAERVVTQVRLAVDMPAAERLEADSVAAVMPVTASAAEAVVDLVVEAEVGSAAAVMPVAASVAATVAAAAMAVADIGNS
jgi:hypothetical protein